VTQLRAIGLTLKTVQPCLSRPFGLGTVELPRFRGQDTASKEARMNPSAAHNLCRHVN
jgi:hypothetical protein